MNNEISKLSGDEIDKFNSVIELYGFSIDDFGIAEIRESTDNEDIKIVKSIKGKIKIIRMSLLGCGLNGSMQHKLETASVSGNKDIYIFIPQKGEF